jgi:DNA-directed RNA polymerase subunit RPC12/RpoP
MRRFEPMTVANMRANGVRMVIASCANCGRSADVNVDLLPETLTVPEAGNRLRCGSCGGKTISTRPAWHTGRPPPRHAGLSARRAADVLGDRDRPARRLVGQSGLGSRPEDPWQPKA